MASIPTASVDALVHVKRLRRPKNGAAVHYPLRLSGSSCIWSFGLQSFKAWQIAAITNPFSDLRIIYRLHRSIWARAEEGQNKMSDGPMNSAAGRSIVLAAVASLALVATSASPSAAASAGPAKAVSAKVVTAGQAASDVTDFSAARRRYYRRGPNAAGLAVMGAAAGIIGGVIAEQRRREYYEDNYYYGQRPYYGGPGYYGGGPYYGQRYYYQPY
jgi:hypothetical protein